MYSSDKSENHGKLWSICFFTITFVVAVFFFLRETKNKTTSTAWHVTSFPWFLLSETIAMDQSAREDSLSYCKNNLSGWVDLLHVTSPTWGPPPLCKQALKQSKIKCYFKKMLLNPSGFKSPLRIHAKLSLFITSVAIVLKLSLLSLLFVCQKFYKSNKI